MKHDADKFMVFFNYYLASRYAVDEDLHTLITSCYDQPTHSIQRMLTQMYTEKYMNDQIYYLHACRAKKVRLRKPNVISNGQSTLDPLLVDVSELPGSTAAERTLLSLTKDIKRARLDLLRAESTARDNVDFKSLHKLKGGRNKRKAMLPSMGEGKLQEYMDHGFNNGRDLVAYNGVHPHWFKTARRRDAFRRMQATINSMFKTREEACEKLRRNLIKLNEQHERQEETVALEAAMEGIVPVGRDDNRQRNVLDNLEARPPAFAKMFNPEGYNARSQQALAALAWRQPDA